MRSVSPLGKFQNEKAPPKKSAKNKKGYNKKSYGGVIQMIDKTMTNEDLAVIAQQTNDDNIKKECLQELYISNLPLIRQMVSKYVGQGVELSDLMDCAFLGIAAACRSYNVSKAGFFSFAKFHIQRECRELLRQSAFSFSVPSWLFIQINKYNTAVKYLSQAYKRSPTDNEICEYMEITKTQLNQIKAVTLSPVPLDSPLDCFDDDSVLVGDAIATDTDIEGETLDKMNSSRLASELWSFLQDKIEGRSYDMIRLHYCEGLTYDEIATKYNISRQRVQQIISDTFATLRNRESSLVRLLGELESIGVECAYKSSFGKFEQKQASCVEVAVLRRDEKKTEIIQKIENEKEKTQQIQRRRYWRRRGSAS